MKRIPSATLRLAAAGLTVVSISTAVGAGLAQQAPNRTPVEIGVYSGRHYNTDKELYRQFTARTGIKVNVLESKDDAIIERLKSEGRNTPADVLVLVDAARLDIATDQGLFQPSRSAALQRDVPANLRDSQGRWYGLTRRVRAVVVNPKLVNPATIRTYADLANPALRGKLCLRERKSPYNQSLVASQMILRGDATTRNWVRGMVANVKQPFFTSDTPLARAVARGECAVGVVNSYYVARMLSGAGGAEDKRLAQQVKIVYVNPSHVNISGAGVTRHAKNPQAALRLIEFLASPTGGRGYAEANNEYPLKGVGDNPYLKGFGTFRADGVSVEQIGSRSRAATQMMEANGWK
jgi:iron(III) transport system substrate-binding protein